MAALRNLFSASIFSPIASSISSLWKKKMPKDDHDPPPTPNAPNIAPTSPNPSSQLGLMKRRSPQLMSTSFPTDLPSASAPTINKHIRKMVAAVAAGYERRHGEFADPGKRARLSPERESRNREKPNFDSMGTVLAKLPDDNTVYMGVKNLFQRGMAVSDMKATVRAIYWCSHASPLAFTSSSFVQNWLAG